MKKLVILLIIAFAVLTLAFLQDKSGALPFGEVALSSCSECHEEHIDAYANDIHSERGITCGDCHDNISLDHLEAGPDDEWEVRPLPWNQPKTCGKCHSDALVMKRFSANPDISAEVIYKTSQHGNAMDRIQGLVETGKLAKIEGAELAGNVATCTSCHGVHGIAKISSPNSRVFPQNVSSTCGSCHGSEEVFRKYSDGLKRVDSSFSMSDSKISMLTDVMKEYSHKENVHRAALEDNGMLDAPTCNDCHGHHGATPPGAFGASRVAQVCGQCHGQVYAEFKESIKAEIFEVEELKDCMECHSNHRINRTFDDMVGFKEKSVCMQCHSDDQDDPGYKVISGISASITSLNEAAAHAREKLEKAEQLGINVDKGLEKLVEMNTALVTARGKIHSFSVEPVEAARDEGLKFAEEANLIAEEAMEEVNFRQLGLGIASILILFTCILIYLKIRQIEKKKS